MKRIFLVIVPLLLLFASCATTSNQYLASEYQEPEQSATISILPIQAEVFFDHFPGYTFGRLENDQAGTFEQYLPFFIEKNTQADVKEVLIGTDLEGENFELKELPLKSDEKFQVLGPKENNSLKTAEIDTRFTLILDQFNYQLFEVEVGGGSYAGHETETETRLKFETKYLIWDNKTGQPAAWGKVNSIKKYTVLERQILYQELLDDVIKKILNKSPFS